MKRFYHIIRVIALRLMPSRVVDGIPLISGVPGADIDGLASSLSAAIERLRQYDVRRYKSVRARVKHVFLWPGTYNAYDRFGGLLLSGALSLEASEADLVGTLVHEATHLRLEALGIRYRPALRSRIERLCIREQLEAMRKCQLISEEAAEAVRKAFSGERLSYDSRADDIEQSLVANGLPRWLAHLVKPVWRT